MNRIILTLIAIALIATSCSEKSRKYTYDGFAQGTTYHIAYHSESGEVVTQQMIDSILLDFNKSCSIYDTTSLISALNSNKTDSLDQNIIRCIEYAHHFNKISEGLYDITVKPLVKAYGFIDNKAPEGEVMIDSILVFIGMEKIYVSEEGRLAKSDPRTEIDLNSIAQGFSVDLISEFIESRGINNYIVEIGGEIFAKGNNTGNGWRVGIDRPVDGSYIPGKDIQAIITLKDRGLTTSGNYRKFFTLKSGERINHSIDPKTGKSSHNDMLSATVIAANAALADGYTTTFILMGKDKSIEYLNQNPNIEALLVFRERDSIKTYITKGLKTEIEMINK